MGYKMNGFSGFKSSPAKHDKSAGGHSKKYGKHTNADHPDYWKEKGGMWSEKDQETMTEAQKQSHRASHDPDFFKEMEGVKPISPKVFQKEGK